MSHDDMRFELEGLDKANAVVARAQLPKIMAQVMPPANGATEVHYHFHGNFTITVSGNSPEVYVGDAPVRVSEAKNGRRY